MCYFGCCSCFHLYCFCFYFCRWYCQYFLFVNVALCCIKSVLNIMRNIFTVNSVASVSWTASNVTAYMVFFVSVIIGVGCSGGWYILLQMFILPWLIRCTIPCLRITLKFRIEKMIFFPTHGQERPLKRVRFQIHYGWPPLAIFGVSDIYCNWNHFLTTFHIYINMS